MRRRLLPLALVSAVLPSCAVRDVHPDPDAAAPAGFRGAAASASGSSFADADWAAVFPDPVLRELLAECLRANRDLAVAAARIEEARAVLGLADADRGPTLEGRGALSASEASRSIVGDAPDRTTDAASAGLFASWEVDLWGRLARLSDAARADLLATEWAAAAVRTSLVADVASAYYTLRGLDLELAISRSTLASRRESLRLTQRRQDLGVGDMLDVRRAETLVETAARQIPVVEEQIARTENALRFLAGGFPGDVRRGPSLDEQRLPDTPPVGTPADLLDRRPDVLLAEAALAASEARVDAAKALYYPRIALTADAGLLTGGGTEFLSSDSRFADAALGAVFPIFTSGRVTSNLDAERARARSALLTYEQSVRAAVRDVADAVATDGRTKDRTDVQLRLRDALADAARLARLRFDGGVDSYFAVLDAERDLFDAELDLVRAQRDRLVARVLLHRALGGGWRDAGPADGPSHE